MKHKSIWLENIVFKNIKKLTQNKEVDVLIIGGGITGLTTAYNLIDSNLKVCLVEQNLIAHGVSSKTTGKLTYLQENIYTKLGSKALLYYKSQKDAILIVNNIIKKNNIDCDYKNVASYIYTNKDSDIKKLKKEAKILKELNIKYQENNKLPIDINCKYALKVDDTYVFHPVKYLTKLKEIITKNKIEIYENSKVTSIEKTSCGYMCNINNKTIKAKKVVVATHYPFFLFPFLMPLKNYIEKSYLTASLIESTKNFSAITVDYPVESMRYYTDKYFIYLMASHKLCSNYNYQKNFNKLLNTNLDIKYIWSNHDIMTADNLVYIGYITEDLLIGTGYNTWGMTNGTLAGKILSDLIQNKDNEYIELFNPKRNILFKDIIKYPLYMTYSAKALIENKLIKNKSWYSKNVSFETRNGKQVAIYIDDKGIRHIVYSKCPHLKCNLLFNEVEKTWDCPCHGSRFSLDGICISGPSTENIGYQEKN